MKYIIKEYAWHLNSEYGIIRFNEKKVAYMRNWSSFLYNVTTVFNNKGIKFDFAKTLYSDERYKSSRAVNKGVYLCISNYNKEENLNEAIDVIKTFSSKEFMTQLVQKDIFYDIPAYHSLILEGINYKF